MEDAMARSAGDVSELAAEADDSRSLMK